MTRLAESTNSGMLDVHRVQAQRSFMLAAVGAVIGLMIAGYALFTANGTSTWIVPAEDVAIVNEQPIARSDYVATLQALYAVSPTDAAPEQRRRALDDLVREELYVQRGKELDVAAFDPDVRTAMVRSVEESAATDAITRVPSESQLRAYYETNRDHYANEGSMTVRDLVFPPGQVRAVSEALSRGRPLEEIVTSFGGRDTQAVKGEEFYFAARIHLGEQLFLVARKLASGGVAGPIAASDGVHVLHMVDNLVPPPFSFEQARSRVQSDFTQAAIKRLQAKQAEFLRKRANVRIAQELK